MIKNVKSWGWKKLRKSNVDFTQEYTIGMRIYYVFYNELTGNKYLYELLISAVYPDTIIAWEPKGCAHMIGPEDEGNIYTERNVAEAFYNQIKTEKRYG